MEPAVEQREDAGGLALINVIDRASIEPTVERREYHATAELGTPGSPAAIEPAIQRRDHNSYTPGRSSITYQLQWIRLSTGGSAAHLNLELYWFQCRLVNFPECIHTFPLVGAPGFCGKPA